MLEGGSLEEAQKIAQLTEEMVLAQMEAAALEQAVLGIGNAFATTMTTGVQELVEGTKSAEEVFADFLRNVANMLMQAAQQMIATYIAIGIAKMFAGMGSSTSSEAASKYGSAANLAGPKGDFGLGPGPMFPFTPKPQALGGAVGAGQPYLVGEKGPELFVPGAQGNIVPNNAMGGSNIVVNVDAQALAWKVMHSSPKPLVKPSALLFKPKSLNRKCPEDS